MSALHSTIPILLLLAVQAPLAAQPTKPAPAKIPSHPAEVAFVDEGAKGFVYRRFNSSVRLYTYDRDPPGGSVCNDGCASAWPPVPAPDDAVPMGEWTIVVRNDGSRQWALKGKPVYTFIHDTPEQPGGDGVDGVWRVIPHMLVATNPPLATR